MAKANTGIILPVGLALAAGAVLLYRSRRASSQQPLEEAEARPRPGTRPPVGRVEAPPYPFADDEVLPRESQQVDTEHAEWLDLMEGVMIESGNETSSPTESDYAKAKEMAGIPANKTIPTALADEAFAALYGIDKIPPSEDRGADWVPYVESWMRMREDLRDKQWVGG